MGFKNLPSNVAIIKNIENIKEDTYKGGLIITDKIINDNAILAKSVIYRPKTLVIGIEESIGTQQKKKF